MKSRLNPSVKRRLESAYHRLGQLSSMTDIERAVEMWTLDRIASDVRAEGCVMRGQRVIGDGRLLTAARLLHEVRETNGADGAIRAAQQHIAQIMGISQPDDVNEALTA